MSEDRKSEPRRQVPPSDPRAPVLRSQFPSAANEATPDPLSIPTPPAFEIRETRKFLAATARVATERRTLTVISGPDAGRVFTIAEPEHFLGRGNEADLRLDDPDVSRRHARIFLRVSDGRYVLEDLRSTNGTFVGGHRVDRCELSPGDRIQCGPNLVLRFAVTDDVEEELHQRMYESSTRDFLTHAYNRKYLMERLIAEVAHARRHRTQLALLLLDLDSFKKTNDEHGHLVGDVVLRAVATRVARLIRVEDVFARYGGEEFVLLARSTSHVDATRLAERIRRQISELEIPSADGHLRITTSIGVASLGELDLAAGGHELIARADQRLYRAKLAGKNRVRAED